MDTKRINKEIDFPFYVYLRLFHEQNKREIYSSYMPLTRKFLNFNDPENPTSFLRPPQFEALEIYVFLKEFLGNKYLYQIFDDWFHKRNDFEGRADVGVSQETGQLHMFGPSELKSQDTQIFKEIFEQIEKFKQIYPNYIFALTMGLGKTVLMATSIFYEFLLANKYPQHDRYCQNALVFAPDKTVLLSLKEIETFDKSKVVPPEYVNWLETHLKFHYLDDSGISLNAIENSRYNIIISNTQKIILKKQHKEKPASQALFEDYATLYKTKSINEEYIDLYGFDINTDQELITNQRFAKLTRLPQMGIYVDEAHHIFGNALAQDFGLTRSSTSLRITINELAESLNEAGTKVVGCYNYTGTPYVGSRLLPEVVYAYGLKESINNKYLKKVRIYDFQNVKGQTRAFVRTAIKEFWKEQKDKRYEGMLPKFAFFASTINELQKKLRPVVENILTELHIPITKILVNVGDSSITSNDDLREFKNLDTPQSDKQFILLVNKGKEGWNCRSLFGVGLHRVPQSRVFVLQATMRCLRSITNVQETAMVYLSNENTSILEQELQENFKVSIDDIRSAGDNKKIVEVRLVPPRVKIKLKRVKKLYNLKEKFPPQGLSLKLDEADTEKYRIIRSERDMRDLSKKIGVEEDVSEIKERREFSEYTLVAEIARYLNRSCLEIKKVLDASKEGMTKIIKAVNEFNELLYDWIIPALFAEFYDLIEYRAEEDVELELVKEPVGKDCYQMEAKPDLVASLLDQQYAQFKDRSFHLDNYCFDSVPEKHFFWTLLNDKQRISKVWFTGMLTHGQSDFLINYIDPVSHTVRSYYPDFLIQKIDGSYVIAEVKGDNEIDDNIVKAKAEYAEQLALASKMTYQIIKSTDALKGASIQ